MERALVGGILVGTICAVIGTYVVLRGLAFIGDALAHAAFPGVVIAYMLKANIYLGAAIFTVGTALGIAFVSRRARTSYDTTIGILFAGAFALGILLMSTIQGYTADLFSFLFGNILGISTMDLLVVGLLAGIVILTVALCYKEFLLLSFDPVVAEAMGYPVQALNSLLLTLVALTIVISIQAVGIVLVVALLVTPSATAYLVTERFFRMMLLGILFSILAIVSGLYLSFYLNVASGATIVLVSTCLFFLTLGVRRLNHPAAPSI
jgi:ABC-type Mn2+/Zn2+ transport system permease subunit